MTDEHLDDLIHRYTQHCVEKMNKFEMLGIAEDVVRAAGSYPMFQHQYTLARQYYDIETSIEMALEQQNLVQPWIEAVRHAQEDRWAKEQP